MINNGITTGVFNGGVNDKAAAISRKCAASVRARAAEWRTGQRAAVLVHVEGRVHSRLSIKKIGI